MCKGPDSCTVSSKPADVEVSLLWHSEQRNQRTCLHQYPRTPRLAALCEVLQLL
jgi:hypothetical protein